MPIIPAGQYPMHPEGVATRRRRRSEPATAGTSHPRTLLSLSIRSRQKHLEVQEQFEQSYFCERLVQERRALYNLETIQEEASPPNSSSLSSASPARSHRFRRHSTI
ncbi:hypothetical protein LTR56_000820, partial [Elasticomyces elasticus]